MNIMKQTLRGAISILVCLPISVLAQAPPKVSPEFEVALIKPSVSFMEAALKGRAIGMKVEQGHMRYGLANLAKLIQTAYGIQKFQLEGPNWVLENPSPLISDGLFDIEAKLPAGATAEQVPAMLQSLLAKRFKLVVRRGAGQSTDTYALVVGKDGPKFRRKEVEATASSSESASAFSGKNNSTINIAGTKTTVLPGRGLRVETSTISGLIEALKTRLDLPVVDKTNLLGNFEIMLQIDPAGSELGNGQGVDAMKDASISSAMAAVQKLGLRLERQKNPMETIVIVSVERTPTQN